MVNRASLQQPCVFFQVCVLIAPDHGEHHLELLRCIKGCRMITRFLEVADPFLHTLAHGHHG